MVVVNKGQVTLDEGKLVTFASDIGIPAGEWPDFISVLDERNEGFLFGPSFRAIEDGGREYFGSVGSLVVFND